MAKRPSPHIALVLTGLDRAWQREVNEISEPLYRRPAAIALKSAAVQIAKAFAEAGWTDDAHCVLAWLDERPAEQGTFFAKAHL